MNLAREKVSCSSHNSQPENKANANVFKGQWDNLYNIHAYPEDPQAPFISVCSLSHGYKEENPGLVPGLVLQGMGPQTSTWSHSHCGKNSIIQTGRELAWEVACPKSKDLGCLPSEYMKLILIYLSSHLRERRCLVTSILIYMRLQSGYEVIKQERRPQGMHMLFS